MPPQRPYYNDNEVTPDAVTPRPGRLLPRGMDIRDEDVTPDDAPTGAGGSRWGDYAGMLTRGIGGFLGSEGLLPGAAINAGADLIAQTFERFGGSRKSYDLADTGIAAAAGAVPFGKAASLLASAGKGALVSGTASAGSNLLHQIEDAGSKDVDFGDVARSGVAGATFGGIGGGAGHLVGEALGKVGSKAAGLRDVLKREAAAAGENPNAASYRYTRPGGETATGVSTIAPGRRALGPEDPFGPGAPLRSPSTDRMNLMDQALAEAEAVGAPGPRRAALEPGNPSNPVIETPPAIRRSMEAKQRQQDYLASLGAPGASKFEANPIPHSWSNGTPVTELPEDLLAPRGRPGTLPNGLPDLNAPLPVTLSGDSSLMDDIIPSNVRGGYANEVKRTGFRTYKGDEPGADGDQLLDFLDPERGVQHNASGATDASTEALSRKSDLAARGVQQYRVSATGERQLQIDPAQLADPWQHLGPGESVIRVHPDGTIEPVAGDLRRGAGAGTSQPGAEPRVGPAGEADLGDMGDVDLSQFSEPEKVGKLFVPAEHVVTHREILDRIAAKPGATPPEGTLADFSRRLQMEPNPRKLMGLERKATAAARARVGDRMLTPVDPTPHLTPNINEGIPDFPGIGDDAGGELGSADPELLRKIGLHLGSAAAGGATAGYFSDPENRTRNIIGGAIVGGVAPLGMGALNRARYFSMLASPSAQIKNLTGNAGTIAVKAGELALSGDVQGAKNLLSSVFSKGTVDRIAEAYKDAPMTDTRWGTTAGPLGVPSRIMHAIDEGVTSGAERGGLSPDEARTTLFTARPKSETGQWIADRPEGANFLVPFARTATNMVERGLEHTPGIGELPWVKGMRNSPASIRLARQAMGAAALGVGAYAGADNPYVAATLGPLAIPYAAGSAATRALRNRGDAFKNLVTGEVGALQNATPLPSDYSWDPGRYLASYIPGVVANASLDAPGDFSTSRSIFDPAIAKIPGLNRAVLPRRARKARAR